MAKITRMPGRKCRFYMNGRCLYEEMLNPGYDRSLRCRVIGELEAEYDRLLRQAEPFGLDEEAFTELWEKRVEEHLKSKVVCRKMIPREDNEFPFCAAFHDELCLLEIAKCEGVCRRFELERD